jgi:phage shock protein A
MNENNNSENEVEIDLDRYQQNAEEKLKVKNRFEKLSEKVILTTKEKEEAEARAKAESDARLKVEKERDFYKDFSQVSSKYPHAASYQDKILEKVNSGYSAEDAAISILAKEGKLQPITADTIAPSFNPAGGSASTAMTDSMDKNPAEMSRDELRKALMEQEKQGVNILKF